MHALGIFPGISQNHINKEDHSSSRKNDASKVKNTDFSEIGEPESGNVVFESKPEYFDFDCIHFLIYLKYKSASGEISERKVRVLSCRYKIEGLDFVLHGFSGYCFIRKSARKFVTSGIVEIADGETGEIWDSVIQHFMKRSLPANLLRQVQKTQD